MMIYDHSSQPRNFGHLHAPSAEANGINPTTGDQLNVQIQIADQAIKQIQFSGRGSSLAITSGSIMTTELSELTVENALEMIESFLATLHNNEAPVSDNKFSDTVEVLLEIRSFPHRVRCTALAWTTARIALQKL